MAKSTRTRSLSKMSNGKKRKFFINEKEAIDLLTHGYALQVKVMNFYQFRIRQEEVKEYFWDWYHTQGTVVINHNGANIRWRSDLGDPEELAIQINEFIRKNVEL